MEVILRQKDGDQRIHLINRASGIPQNPHDGTVDEIPPVGPVKLEIDVSDKPRKVELALEKGELDWKFVKKGKKHGRISVTLTQLHLHAAVVIQA